MNTCSSPDGLDVQCNYLTWRIGFVFEQAEGSFALEWRDAPHGFVEDAKSVYFPSCR